MYDVLTADEPGWYLYHSAFETTDDANNTVYVPETFDRLYETGPTVVGHEPPPYRYLCFSCPASSSFTIRALSSSFKFGCNAFIPTF